MNLNAKKVCAMQPKQIPILYWFVGPAVHEGGQTMALTCSAARSAAARAAASSSMRSASRSWFSSSRRSFSRSTRSLFSCSAMSRSSCGVVREGAEGPRAPPRGEWTHYPPEGEISTPNIHAREKSWRWWGGGNFRMLSHINMWLSCPTCQAAAQERFFGGVSPKGVGVSTPCR